MHNYLPAFCGIKAFLLCLVALGFQACVSNPPDTDISLHQPKFIVKKHGLMVSGFPVAGDGPVYLMAPDPSGWPLVLEAEILPDQAASADRYKGDRQVTGSTFYGFGLRDDQEPIWIQDYQKLPGTVLIGNLFRNHRRQHTDLFIRNVSLRVNRLAFRPSRKAEPGMTAVFGDQKQMWALSVGHDTTITVHSIIIASTAPAVIRAVRNGSYVRFSVSQPAGQSLVPGDTIEGQLAYGQGFTGLKARILSKGERLPTL